jgi:hypothetical protein
VTPDTAALPDLTAFARANGMSHEPNASATQHRGALFDYLQNPEVTDRFTTADGRVEVGNIEGTVGGSQSSTDGNVTFTVSYNTTSVRSYGYLALRLERALPHLVLDATRNDRTFGSSIPMPIAGGQTLSLEGDFDQHFVLHSPVGYERDALYVFAPNLMALLIDETGDFDVEIVDDMLYAYANKPFELTDATVWQRLGRIVEVVGSKTLRQTNRYSDDRVEADGVVGEDGRRLQMGVLGATPKKGFGKLGWIVVGAFAAFIAIFAVVGFIIFNALRSAFGG